MNASLAFVRQGLRLGLLVGAAFACPTDGIQALAAQEPLEFAKIIAMPGVRGRIDHLDIDLIGNRLFVAALGHNAVEVIDLQGGRTLGRFEHLREPQGVAYVSKTEQLFVANGGGDISVFAGTPMRLAGTIGGLEDADYFRFDGAGRSLYVGYGHALAAIEATSHKVTARVPLAGHPEGFQLDANSARIFVNVLTAGQIAVVDSDKLQQLSTWHLVNAAANFPMALDAAHRRLFVGTRRPPRLLVYDMETGNVTATLPIGSDVDDLFYDAKRRRIYAICGEGVVNVIRQRDVNEYTNDGEVRTAPGARTGLFVAERSELYVAIPAREGSPAEIRAYTVR